MKVRSNLNYIQKEIVFFYVSSMLLVLGCRKISTPKSHSTSGFVVIIMCVNLSHLSPNKRLISID